MNEPCFGLDQGNHGWALLWVGSGEPWMCFALGWIRVAMDGLCFGLDQGNHGWALLWVGSGGIKGLN